MEVSELVPRPEWALPTSQETKVSCPYFGVAEEVSELVPRPEWALPTSQETKDSGPNLAAKADNETP